MESREQAEDQLRENLLEAQAMAALGGHDLESFEPVDEPGMMKYQAFCLKCGKSVYVSTIALYSILEESCPGIHDDL